MDNDHYMLYDMANWVKTKRRPFVNIKIAGIYGSVHSTKTLFLS